MLIHCTMEELLAVRDGEGTQAALRHLDDCEDCRNELEKLHQRVAGLKSLATMPAPRDRWPVIKQQVLAGRNRKRRATLTWISAAVAASLVLLVGGIQVIPTMLRQEPEELVYLVEEAEELQDLLILMEPEMRVMNGRIATAIAEIEDRLLVVDSRLAEARAMSIDFPRDDLIILMRRRVDLMDALVRIHATKSTYFGF